MKIMITIFKRKTGDEENDLTRTERGIQKRIWRKAWKKKERKRVKLGYKKIKVGEDEWEWNDNNLEKKIGKMEEGNNNNNEHRLRN